MSDPVIPGLASICRDRAGASYPVRHLGVEDRSRLEAFYEAFEPKRAAQGLPPAGQDRIGRWLDAILASGLHLVVEVGEDIAGHAFLLDTGKPGEAEYAIFLRDDLRGRGIGTCVNRVAVAAARTRGWTRLWLSVEPHNRAAIRSYQKVGFEFIPGTVFLAEAEMTLQLGQPLPEPPAT